jgi:hypothetical protein
VLVHLNPQKNKHSSATFVNILLNNFKITAGLDSGAESTLINSKLASKLHLKIQNCDENIKYIAANGQPLTTVGWSIVNINIGSYFFRQKCTIINNLATDVLLGTDTLAQHGMILNYLNKTLSVGKVTAKLITEKPLTAFSLVSCAHTKIEPRSTHVMWIKVPDSFRRDPLVLESIRFNEIRIQDGLY